MDRAYVYMMSNWNNKVLYVGVTNDLVRRVAEHKAKINDDSFTKRYNVNKLVYYETFPEIYEALEREKQLKGWKREWKDALVNKENENWQDLSDVIGVTNEFVESVEYHYKQKIADQVGNDAE